jgi:hypothetical protein
VREKQSESSTRRIGVEALTEAFCAAILSRRERAAIASLSLEARGPMTTDS